ncbi:MAG: nucleoside 2-deoxyribosyltransferase domain-containing protein [Bacteroidota bacterium]
MTNNGKQIRTLFAREHETVFPRLGVFLAGPTPPSGKMRSGWRRVVIESLRADDRLDPSMLVVAPEPESGQWTSIDHADPQTELDIVRDKQIPWELQYLQLCDITAFWLPTYWDAETAGVFTPNIGPTSRWEFGYFFQEFLKNPTRRHFIVGSPADAESVKWAKRITDMHGVKWHTLPVDRKQGLVVDSFIEEIANTLLANRWEY